MRSYNSASVEETEGIAQELAKEFGTDCVICMSGDLGAGKTSFVRGYVSAIGDAQHVSSPSYTIYKKYDGEYPIYHFDFYRLTDFDDLESIGFYDIMAEKAIKIIEWGEMFESELPKDFIKIKIEKISENERIINVYNNTCD